MAYETYTTEALICGAFDKNTADRSYLLFTREAGMLYATARSVREERSRQRYALQDFSLLRVSLVKGKGGWRIGSIEPERNFYQMATDQSSRQGVVSIFRLLRRFLQGEVIDHELFDYVIAALTELTDKIEHPAFVLLVTQVRILTLLGYVDLNVVPEAVKTVPPQRISAIYSPDLTQRLEKLYTHAISVSHL